ncbi:hypothetical protein FWG76_01175 [Candidatus Saccharibacteria bacterium]|nr:hypothetical protein [Candidatus Saccharibacteria bacterium]
MVKRRDSHSATSVSHTEDCSALLSEIDHFNKLTELRTPTVMATLHQPRRARSPLDRTRNRCVRELKALFATYLSGDYERDNASAVSLGQISAIGEILEAESPENTL